MEGTQINASLNAVICKEGENHTFRLPKSKKSTDGFLRIQQPNGTQ